MLVTDTLTGNTGLSQNVKWGGGSFALAFNNNRQSQSDAFATRNPAINANFTAAYVQPLLRNFRIDGTRAQLRITQINQDISEVTLRATIARTLANVRNAYWDYVYAIQAAEVAERSLALATKLVEDNQARVEVGTLAPLDVVQAQAEQANRRQTVATTAAARRTAELALKRLIVNGTDDPLWTSSIEPIDRPTYSSSAIDVADAVRRALGDADRPRPVAAADAGERHRPAQPGRPAAPRARSLGQLRDGGRRRPDVRAQQSARRHHRRTRSRAATPTRCGFSGIVTAPTWNFGLDFSYPIGTSTAEANTARARLQQRQTIAQQPALELQIATEVTNAALQVEAGRERLQAAQAALDLEETPPRGRTEPLRRRTLDELLRRAGAARPPRRAERRAARPARLSPRPGRLRTRAGDSRRRRWRRHHEHPAGRRQAPRANAGGGGGSAGGGTRHARPENEILLSVMKKLVHRCSRDRRGRSAGGRITAVHGEPEAADDAARQRRGQGRRRRAAVGFRRRRRWDSRPGVAGARRRGGRR